MSFDVGAPRRRRHRLVWLGLAGIAVLLVATVVAVRSGETGPRAARVVPPAVAPGRPPATASTGRDAMAPLPVLRLPRPRGSAGFVPVGFGYGPAGAASAVWHWTPVLFGLDPDTVAAAAGVWADLSYRDAPARMAAATVRARAAVGLAPSGPAGAAYLVVAPRMVRIVVADPDRPVVDVLAQVSAGSVSGGTSTRTVVLDCYLRWTGTDYRLLDHALSPARAADPPAPDSPAAVAVGYRAGAEQ